MSKVKSSHIKYSNGDVGELLIDLDNTYDKYKISVKDFSKKAVEAL